MNKLIIEQNTNQVELVDNATISNLYNKVKTIPEPLEDEDDLAYLSGYIESDYSVLSLVEYLAGRVGLNGAIVRNPNGRFENLIINTNDSYLMEFEDPLVKNILVANWGGADGGFAELNTRVNNTKVTGVAGEITKELMASIKNIGTVFQETNISSFNELQYCSLSELLNNSFYGCSNLTNITLPNNITKIRLSSFDGCTNLTLITIPNTVTLLDYGAFLLSGLTSIIIPDNVTLLGAVAFRNCSDLENVVIGSGVTTINDSCFLGCTNLTSIYINSEVLNAIQKLCFLYDSALSAVYITNLDVWPNILFTNNESNPLFYAHHLYLNNQLVTNVTIPDTYTLINKSIFVGASDITNITIPNTVTYIYEYAFYNCTGLTSINIPSGVTGIKADAFRNCSSLSAVHITDLDTWCNIDFGNIFSNPLYYAHHLYLNNNEVTSIIIPNNINKVKKCILYRASNITSITLHNGITEIGAYAFGYCSQTSMVIPDSVTVINERAFTNCTSLSSVIIGNGVTTIGEYTFSECTSLTSLTIGNNVTSIGSYAFYGCSSLTSIIIPNSVTSIGDRTFGSCTGLTSIIIPDNVTIMGDSVFYYCRSLASITIGSGITSLGSNLTQNCSSLLTSVTIKANIPPSITSTTFVGNYLIYVPSQSVEAYKAAEGWSTYASRILAIPV